MCDRALLLWAPVAVYMAAIFYVSSLPHPPVPPGGDKPWHLLAYLGLGVVDRSRASPADCPRRIQLARRGRSHRDRGGLRRRPTRCIRCSFPDDRRSYDLLADAIGVVAGHEPLLGVGRSSQVTRRKAQGTSHKAAFVT